MNNKLYPWMLRGVIALFMAAMFASCGVLDQISKGKQGDTEYGSVFHKQQILLVATLGDKSEEGAVYTYGIMPQKLEAKQLSTFYTPSPTFMAFNTIRNHLYITNELPNDAMLTATTFNSSSGAITSLNQSYTLGAEPTYVALQDDKVITANYGGGNITLFRTESDGTLSEANWRIDLSADGSLSRPHSIFFTPSGKDVYVTDLAQDKVFHFRVHRTVPPITVGHEQTVLSKGSGPRHIIFDRQGKYAYVVNEKKPTVMVYRKHFNGVLELVQEINTGRPTDGAAAHIALSKDGRYLYTSHRINGDGIVVFSVDQRSGEIKQIGFQPTGKHPRQFTLSPDGKYMAVAARDSGQVEFYRRDRDTGLLEPTGYTIKTKKPVFLLWEEF
ncbi:MAG: lactonase family protein [Porphyromonas sp.]|nr:lactonase family protein [Porphyromonas sp.]